MMRMSGGQKGYSGETSSLCMYICMYMCTCKYKYVSIVLGRHDAYEWWPKRAYRQNLQSIHKKDIHIYVCIHFSVNINKHFRSIYSPKECSDEASCLYMYICMYTCKCTYKYEFIVLGRHDACKWWPKKLLQQHLQYTNINDLYAYMCVYISV